LATASKEIRLWRLPTNKQEIPELNPILELNGIILNLYYEYY
jgi:hypothetical protein